MILSKLVFPAALVAIVVDFLVDFVVVLVLVPVPGVHVMRRVLEGGRQLGRMIAIGASVQSR